VSWADFDGITTNAPDSAFRQFHGNDLKQWYRLLLRSSSFLNLGLHERIAIALLELCSDFGIEESRGTLLRVPFSHKDIANLVGASRPRITEHLARLEREKFMIRQGRDDRAGRQAFRFHECSGWRACFAGRIFLVNVNHPGVYTQRNLGPGYTGIVRDELRPIERTSALADLSCCSHRRAYNRSSHISAHSAVCHDPEDTHSCCDRRDLRAARLLR
jgi:hypothetical protein